jgi:putative tryptophan/tyrosine transport system substrate-binding protein
VRVTPLLEDPVAIKIARREFIATLGGTALAWPVAARAQQPGRTRRIGMLWNMAADDPEGQTRLAAFLHGLQELGWTDGSNVRIDIRWAEGVADGYHRYPVELLALAPDVLYAAGTQSVAALQKITRSVPIVFANVVDPVGAGFIASLARPGGNTTGTSAFEYSLRGKWLELLKEIAPRLTRVAVLRDSSIPSGIGQFAVIQAMAPQSFELTPIDMRDLGEMESAITAFASQGNGGLIVTASQPALPNRGLVISLATRYRLPNIYAFRYYPASGGLASYGPDPTDVHKRAATYVDRVLKGEKPAELPVQAPTKYELVINLKTAKALELTVPPSLLARADEVIE